MIPLVTRSCTAEHPARRLDESVRRGNTVEVTAPGGSVPRPSTSSGIVSAMRSRMKQTATEDRDGEIGGSSSSFVPSSSRNEQGAGGAGKDAQILSLTKRVEALEDTVAQLTSALNNLRGEFSAGLNK